MHGTVGGGFDLRMAFFEHRARLTAGTGCEPGFPVICGAVDVAFPVDVSLDDRSDVANVNSFTQRLSLDAGSGDDDVLAGGFDATAHGGPGSEMIRLAANNGTRGTGGSGRDRITGGLGAVAAILEGGSGGDLLVPDGSLFRDANGGTGADQSRRCAAARSGSPARRAPTCWSSPRRAARCRSTAARGTTPRSRTSAAFASTPAGAAT